MEETVEDLDKDRERRGTHAVSGASLSLFSSRYLTSEMSKQPALLNSTGVRSFMHRGLVLIVSLLAWSQPEGRSILVLSLRPVP